MAVLYPSRQAKPTGCWLAARRENHALLARCPLRSCRAWGRLRGMGVVFEIIATYAPYIYLVCGLVALYQLYRLWQVRSERRQAVFSLERERAVRDLSGIFTMAMLMLVLMGITYFASSTIPRAIVAAPEVQATLPPEFAIAITPTNTPIFVTPSATPTGTLTPTPEPPTPDAAAATQTAVSPQEATQTPTPEAQAPQPETSAPFCPDSRAVISSPGAQAQRDSMVPQPSWSWSRR